jgi:peptidoglycan/xylan/chitin deacetylase (PgdA/CDA1 family)
MQRDSFVALLDRLQSAARFTTDLLAPCEGTATFALTLDDGSEDHSWVGQCLVERGLRGVFFLTSGLIGEPGFVTWAQARQLAAQGHEVGSHGVDHLPVRSLSRVELMHQVRASKERLEDELQVPVRYFAPPFGYDASGLREALRSCGYHASRLTRWGLYRPDGGNPWLQPSVPLTEFTVTTGWLDRILDDGRIPAAMRATQLGRAVLPEQLRVLARRALRWAARGRTSGR